MRFFLLFVFALSLSACVGTDGLDGIDGEDGVSASNSVLRVSDGSAMCDEGGQLIESGLDTSGDGVLDDDEVENSVVVCDGVNGEDGADGMDGVGTDGSNALVNFVDEPVGGNCDFGGTRVDFGIDADGSGILEAAEVDGTYYLCDGTAAVYGNTVDLGETGNFGANFLLGQKQTITSPGTLIRFGVVSNAGGMNSRYAIYADDGGSPGVLVTETANNLLAAGAQEFDFSTQITVPAGDYWLMGLYQAAGDPKRDDVFAIETKFISHTFGTPLPSAFPTTHSTYTAQSFNYWIVVKED